VVGAVVRHRYPQVRLELLDIDAVALEAARENLPGARILLGDGLPAAEDEAYDVMVTNPPFHRGKAEEAEMITHLVREAPGILSSEGGLVLVAQRRIEVEGAFRGSFRRVEMRADGGGFRVWEGWKPT
jgi:16S rRNA (guanine1207-N2)-methyltransferase